MLKTKNCHSFWKGVGKVGKPATQCYSYLFKCLVHSRLVCWKYESERKQLKNVTKNTKQLQQKLSNNSNTVKHIRQGCQNVKLFSERFLFCKLYSIL